MNLNRYTPDGKFSAIFIDYENIFYHLRDRYGDIPELNDYVLDLLRALKTRLEDESGLSTIIMKAYADFERLKNAPQGSLYLMGIDTHNVLGTEHKNAADMRLCIDVLEIMYTRPEIDTFILFAGDRDYIPVIQHLRKQARKVLTVAFRENLSGDLLLNVGQDNFLDAQELFKPERIRKLEEAAKRQKEIEASIAERESQIAQELQEKMQRQLERQAVDPPVQDTVATKAAQAAQLKHEAEVERKQFHFPTLIVSEHDRTCLKVLLQNYGHHSEIWLAPFLRKLSDAMPMLADYERKALITNLENFGAIAVEKRHGEPFDYAVIVLNYNHPTVRELFGSKD